MAAENTNSTNRFELDGVEYEVPNFLDLTLDDWVLVYDETKVVLADFGPILNDDAAEKERQEKIKNPRVEQSFLMVAYLRMHPEETVDTAREVTGRAKLIALLEATNPPEDETPTSATELATLSERRSPEKSEPSPAASPKISERPEGLPVASGTIG